MYILYGLLSLSPDPGFMRTYYDSRQSECGESLKRKERVVRALSKKRDDLNKVVEEQQASINYMQTQLKQVSAWTFSSAKSSV